MNIHHLELFYYVARHGGIVPAVRNMPYGIQQPAVSGQIARLEESLGTKLFNRRPFALLPPGVELYEFIRPFFDEIDHVGEAIRGGSTQQLRVAAPRHCPARLSPGNFAARATTFSGLPAHSP
jgi:DNA-binding transcriptional LysR family regulator